MQVSNYNIYVPLPKSGRYVLIHGYTGAIDFADVPLVENLKRWFTEGRIDCESSLEANLAAHLEARGYLTEKSLQEEIQFVQQFSERLLEIEHRTRSKFFIIPSYNCQLRCTYCFERGVQNSGAQEGWLRTIMPREMVDAAFGAIEGLQTEPTRHPISLYGGEPFTRANREIVTYIVQRGNELGYRFTAITNGVDIDAYRHLLRPDLIEGLLVTIDGPQRTHDRTRIFPSGRGSFDRIVRNVQMALDCGLKIRIRINTDWNVLTTLSEFAEFVRAQGWDNNPSCVVYCQRVRTYHQASQTVPEVDSEIVAAAFENGVPERIQPIALANIIRFLQNMQLHKIISAGEPIRYKLDMLNKSNPFAALSPTCCGSHKGMYLFDPFGKVYVCTEHVGKVEESVGTFWPELQMIPEKITKWHNRAVHNLPACQRCRYALLCGGGCAYLAEVELGNMYKNYCERFAEQFELVAQEYFDGNGPKDAPKEHVHVCD